MRRGCRYIFAGALATLGSVAVPETTLAQDVATPAPKLSVSQTTVQMEAEGPGFFETSDTVGEADGRIIVSNTGSAEATDISVTGFYGDGTTISAIGQGAATGADGLSLAPNQTIAVDVSFDWSRTRKDTGWLVVQDAAHASPSAVVPFQVRELVPGRALGWILLLTGGLALLVMAVANAMVRRDPPDRAKKPRWSDPIATSGTWSFKDSWASNLTALGVILGTVLAASGFLTDVLPGLATGAFLGMSLAYGVLIVLAPIVLTAMETKNASPTYGGMLTAGWLTTWAALGELLTAAELVARGALAVPAGLVVVGTLALAVLFGAYARASIAQVIKPPDPKRKARAREAAGHKMLEVVGLEAFGQLPQDRIFAVADAAADAAAIATEEEDGPTAVRRPALL